MIQLTLIFLIISLVLFVLAAVNIAWPKVNLLAAGLAFWVAAQLVGHIIT